VGLAVQIGLDKERIIRLGLGAILHDIGKTQIPHEIVNKQGKLTDTEYNVIKQHVVRGYEILKEQKEVPEASLIAVLQHHEKLSGRGYPFGIKGKDIKLFGRITSIADCYDSLTTRRPYKPPLTPYFALSIIVKEKGDYDPELLKAFVKMLGKVK
jgi:putative nucleotidyltransferase with HDIG domain